MASGRSILGAAAATAALLFTSACTGAGSVQPTAVGSRATASAAASGPTAVPSPTDAAVSLPSVASSLMGGSLTTPVDWIAQVGGIVPTDPVDHVDFLIDGAVAWTEHREPYQFNDDGNYFAPWVVDPGPHELAITVVTASGATASTQLSVTTTRPAVPASLLGRSFFRTMPGSGVTPAGDWTFTFGENGVITIDDPGGSGVNEEFLATDQGSLTVYGPANWVEPTGRQGGFCDTAEGAATMTWTLAASTLTLVAAQPDPCPGRSFLFDGSWTLRP